jgi:autotransporter translocation and assembly factor TamB
MAEGTNLNFMMNPVSNMLSLRAESQYVERGNILATNLNVNLTNQGDSLAMYLQSEDLYAGAFHLPQLSVMGGAKNDRVSLTSGFRDSVGDLSGVLSIYANILNEPTTQLRRVRVNVLPATITSRGRDWKIASSRIHIDTARIEVERFRVRSGEQELLLEGVMSRQSEDSLKLRLKDFSIAPFMGFASRMGYTVTGKGNGEAYIKAALNRGELTADIDIDSMMVNSTPVAPLCLDSRWDFNQQRARIRVINLNTRDSIVRGYYAPISKRYYAEGRFDNIPAAMLDPILAGVVKGTKGVANARLEIVGQGRQAKLNGNIDVKNLSTMIDYTKVRYTVPSAKVQVKDNHFVATNIKAYDPENNSGLLSMDISLQHLSNISYNLRVVPRNMLVLNTTMQDNDYFYGKVYASGVATVSGSKKGTNLNLVGSTEGNSQFFMPLSGKSDVSNADFVVFDRPGMRPDSTSNYELQRK